MTRFFDRLLFCWEGKVKDFAGVDIFISKGVEIHSCICYSVYNVPDRDIVRTIVDEGETDS